MYKFLMLLFVLPAIVIAEDFEKDNQILSKYYPEWQVLPTNNYSRDDIKHDYVPAKNINTILFEDDGTIWFASTTGLIKKSNIGTTILNYYNSKLPSFTINDIIFGPDNTLWLSTMDGLVHFYNEEKFDIIDSENNNLPDNHSSQIIFDKNGNLWTASYSGASFYDGEKWKLYNSSNSNLPSSLVTSISIDNDNNIWAGTNKGIGLFKNNEWIVFNKENSGLSGNQIRSLHCTESGEIYIGTWGGGLTKYNQGNWTTYDYLNSNILDTQINYVTSDNEGHIWIATSSGIAKLVNDSFESFTTSNSGIPGNDARYLTFDKDNNLWVSVFNKGAIKYSAGKWLNYSSYKAPHIINKVNKIKKAGDAALWIASAGNGMIEYHENEKRIIHSSNTEGLETNNINEFDFDNNGNVIAATNTGLRKFNGVNWENITGNSEYSNTKFYDIEFDGEKIWASGTDGLIISTDGNIFNKVLPPPDLNVLPIIDLEFDINSNLWIATESGTAVLRNGQWQKYNTDTSILPGNNIGEILKGTDGKLYFLVDNRYIALFEENKWSIIDSTAFNLQSLHIYDISINKGGELFAVLHNKGIYKYQDGEFVNFPVGAIDSIKENFYYAEAIDDKIYIGTSKSSLFEYKSETDYKILSPDYKNLPANDVIDMMRDAQGNLWFHTHSAITKYDGEEWHTVNNFITNDFPQQPEWNFQYFALSNTGELFIRDYVTRLYKTDGKYYALIMGHGSLNFSIGGPIRMSKDGVLYCIHKSRSPFIDNGFRYFTFTENQYTEHHLPHDEKIHPYDIQIDSVGNIYFLLNAKSYCKLDKQGNYTFIEKEHLIYRYIFNTYIDNNIYFLLRDENNKYYIQEESPTETCIYYLPEKNGKSIFPHSFTVDLDGNFWVGSGYGAFFYDKNTDEWVNYNLSNCPMNSQPVVDIESDKHGNIYFLQQNRLLVKYKNPGTSVEEKQIMSNNINLKVYPNPNRGNLNISYQIEKPAYTEISISGMNGSVISTLHKGFHLSGKYEIAEQFLFPPGVYFITIKTGKQSYTTKFTMIK